MADEQFVDDCRNIERFLANRSYPEGMSDNKKRGLRKKAANFKLSVTHDGLTELVYTGKLCIVFLKNS